MASINITRADFQADWNSTSPSRKIVRLFSHGRQGDGGLTVNSIGSIPKFTGGKLALVAKNRHGQPLQSRVEAIAVPARVTPDLLPQTGTSIDVKEMVELSAEGAPVEIKEWQAIMAYLQAIPAAVAGELPIVPTDARANEPRFIRL